MFPVHLALPFLLLYVCAKMMEKGMKFYWVAVIFTVLLRVLQLAIFFWSTEQILISLIITLALALPVFYLLDQFEDTIVKWLATLMIGGLVFVYL